MEFEALTLERIEARPVVLKLERPYEVSDSELHMPNVPGVGLAWDEKAVAAHLVECV
jgi:L-alanine-DL-glutamate epimerase-like enolase superfamily enzyme